MTTIYIGDKASLPKRIHFDHYPTERNLINVALETFRPSKANSILDIGAGDGRWGDMAQCLTTAQQLTGIDIRPLPKPTGFTDWYTADFLSWQSALPYDLIVSNPPYHIAEAVIWQAWSMLAAKGTMIMLLRLAFQAGIQRYQTLWRQLSPVTVGICSRRPSFYGGGTNGTDYGIYVWRKDEQGRNLGNIRQWQTVLLMYDREKQSGASGKV